jgi:hypothetical protein
MGETLMTGADPRATLETLIRDSSTPRWAGARGRKGTKVAVKICGITTSRTASPRRARARTRSASCSCQAARAA